VILILPQSEKWIDSIICVNKAVFVSAVASFIENGESAKAIGLV
jgi:hypothetical protein